MQISTTEPNLTTPRHICYDYTTPFRFVILLDALKGFLGHIIIIICIKDFQCK